MTFSDMATAVADSEKTLRFADMMVNRLAYILIGRLRQVDSYGVLNDLKRELRDYNINTGKWK